MNITELIKELSPANNAGSVAVDSAITLLFQTNMDASTLTAENLVLREANGATVALVLSYDALNKTLTATPTAPLAGGTLYQLVFAANGMKTIFGDGLTTQAISYFTTEATEAPAPEPDPDPIVVPEPPPLIGNLNLTASYPEDNAFETELSTLLFAFDADIDPTTVTADSIRLNEYSPNPLVMQLANQTAYTLTPNAGTDAKILSLEISPELVKGKEYQVTLAPTLSTVEGLTLGRTLTRRFQILWDTFYATVADVRLLMGQFAAPYSDQDIARLIHTQSMNVYQTMSGKTDFDETLWLETFPYYAGQYVTYSTAYTFILGQVLDANSGNKRSVVLGDLSVSESTSVGTDVSDLMGLLKAEMEKWWKLLNGAEDLEDGGAVAINWVRTPGSAIKAGTSSPYDDFLTRTPFAELGE